MDSDEDWIVSLDFPYAGFSTRTWYLVTSVLQTPVSSIMATRNGTVPRETAILAGEVSREMNVSSRKGLGSFGWIGVEKERL